MEVGLQMDRQLRWVSDFLDALPVVHWIDSGSLLGLMRGGDLLPHDDDIDVGVWVESGDVLLKHRRSFRRAGYKVRVFKYERRPYKVQLVAESGNGQRHIDINLFRRCGLHAWCPQHIRRPGAVTRATLVGSPLEWYWRTLQPSVSMDRLPWSRMRELWTWWIPMRFFDRCFVDRRLGLPVPGDWAEYLSFRYGEWQVPNKDWDLTRYDGGLQNVHPDELLRGAV